MKIKKFSGHLNEDINVRELPMFFSERFINILKSIDSKISKELLDLLKSDIKFQFSYVDLSDDIDFVSVLPSNRLGRIPGISEEDIENPSNNSPVWGEKFRQLFRIGVFVNRLLPKYAGTKDLENFVNHFKSKLDVENYELRIVRGEEIRKWYHVDNYYNANPGMEEAPEDGSLDIRSPLMKSCLKQPEKQSFFDIYCKNPEQIGMLIMLNKDKKLVARAVLWFDCFIARNPENPPKGVLMDRIYYTQESDVKIFIDYAKEHNWWYKPSQAKEIFSYVVDGVEESRPITTRLKNHGMFAYYPYLDTMCYYTPDTGRLSSNRGRPQTHPKTGEIMERYKLQRANGGVKRLSRDK